MYQLQRGYSNTPLPPLPLGATNGQTINLQWLKLHSNATCSAWHPMMTTIEVDTKPHITRTASNSWTIFFK